MTPLRKDTQATPENTVPETTETNIWLMSRIKPLGTDEES